MHTSGGAAEHRGGLRSRWLAPVYAVVVSFLAVLLLGAVVREPAPPPPPPRTVDLQFVTPGQGRAPLADARVRVLAGTTSELTVNAEGRVDDVASGRPLTICVRLPQGWTASAPAHRLGDFTCWPDVDPDAVNADGRIELAVTRSEVPR